MKKILSTLFILSLLFILIACSPQKKYDIVVSDYFTYDILNNVVGDQLEIKTLQPTHLNYHTYEPSSADLVTLKQAEVFIYTSLLQSPWLKSETHMDTLISGSYTSLEELLKVDDIEEDHDHDHDYDHGFDFLSNPFDVGVIVLELAAYLETIFPTYSETFYTNADLYYHQIIDAVTPYRNLLYGKELDIYFIGHDALNGFSRAFNLNIHALDSHVSPHSDTTSTDLSNFIKEIQNNNITVIYHEEVPNIQTINYMKEMLPDIKMYELHTLHQMTSRDYEAGLGYLDLILRNLENLEKGILI